MDQGLLTTLGRRSAQRINVSSDVGLLDEAAGTRMLGRLRDLSATGASVATSSALALGKELRLAFEFEPGEAPVRLHAEVIWTGRSAGSRGGVVSGIRFVDLAGADFARLREFIDRRLWELQRFLCGLELFSDLNDLEKLLVASVVVDRSLKAGALLEEALGEGALAIVRHGTVSCEEKLPDGRTSGARLIGAGDLAGALPIDPQGVSQLVARASSDAALLLITPDGFQYLADSHAATAFKLLSAWTLSLRDRVLAVPPKR